MEKFLLVFLFLGEAFCFLPTTLNYSDPDLSSLFCPTEMIGKGWDLKALSRESLRLEVRNLFNEEPPPDAPAGFFVPEDASLSEMFHMYYGEKSSATRFYKAVNTIAWANAGVDSSESTKYDTRYHFDGEKITEGQSLLTSRHNLIVSSVIMDKSYDYARQQLGISLHGIQDFYSHSTWVELGYKNILGGLALPGNVIDNVAGEGDQTCTSCSSPEGPCSGNVIIGGKITSGYYEYEVTEGLPFIVEKPDAQGKCSFGGTLDTSEIKESIGGINKASTSPCFSPHYYLHETAASLAIEASQNYLATIRKTIGNEEFRILLDLYEGSALSIVIDTTGSMGPELDAVKAEVALIVENTSPALYILVPYNDPEYGPVTETTDPDVFLAAINALNAKGGGDIPEMVWSGLQLALTATPDYSTLYLFTDAGGKDAELMNGDIALAQSKNIIVTVVYSYSTMYMMNQGDIQLPEARLISNEDDYKRLAELTGGQFIEIDKFDIDSIVPMISNGVEESKVTIALRRDVVGQQIFDFPVDDTISQLEITISGVTETATLTDSAGTVYDLMDQTALEGSPNVVLNTYTLNLKNIFFESPLTGSWTLDLSGKTSYSVTAGASSILGYLVDFTNLDTRPPRPNYKLINGNPLAGVQYYVQIILVGWIDSKVTSVNSMDFIDKKGNVFSDVVYNDEVDDEIFIQSQPLPSQNFYVQTNGLLASGQPFTRIFETLITPVNISVNVDALQSILAAPPNSTVNALYLITNHGPAGSYSYYAADDLLFVNSFSPTSSIIEEEGFEVINVTFYVPPDAKIWSESTVVVSASSDAIAYDINSAISHFLVLPEFSDTNSPTCTSANEPDCSGYNSAETCMDSTWTVSATLVDDGSGLINIYTQPSNDMITITYPPFTPGTNDEIEVIVEASCCVTELNIIGLDSQGNIGVCEYNLGALDGVLTFEAIDVGISWVYLRWTVTQVRSDLNKYTVVTDGDLSTDVRCLDTTCYNNQTFLESCTLHKFSLTPEYKRTDGTTFLGSDAFTEAETLDEVPEPPTNAVLSFVTANSLTLTWDPPAKAACVVFYEVCYFLFATSDEECIQTPSTDAYLSALEACTFYNISITAVTKSGLASAPLYTSTNTDEAAPGAPTNLQVIQMTATTADLSWNAPLENANCAAKYMYSWVPIDVVSAASYPYRIEERDTGGPYETIIFDLIPCTKYMFYVTTVSKSNLLGGVSEAIGDTDETDPTPPDYVDVETTGTTSVSTTWSSVEEFCVDHYLVCLDDNLTNICYNVSGNNVDYEDLQPCTEYYVHVAAVSPSGNRGQFVTDSSSTDDEAPGSPTNLEVTDVTSHSVTLAFDYPTENPQCIFAYDATFSYVGATVMMKASEDTTVKTGATDTITGLDACADVIISVRLRSPQGLSSDWVNTTATTLEDVPTAVQELQVRETTTTTIIITWFAPQDNDKCVDNYEINWTSLNEGSTSASYVVINNQPQFEYDIVGLTPCTTYTIGVTPITPSGIRSSTTHVVDTTLC